MFWWWGKLEHLEKKHGATERTCKLYTVGPCPSQRSNIESSSCEITVHWATGCEKSPLITQEHLTVTNTVLGKKNKGKSYVDYENCGSTNFLHIFALSSLCNTFLTLVINKFEAQFWGCSINSLNNKYISSWSSSINFRFKLTV